MIFTTKEMIFITIVIVASLLICIIERAKAAGGAYGARTIPRPPRPPRKYKELKAEDSSETETVIVNEGQNEKLSGCGSKSGWHGRIYTNNPTEIAYKIILLLEKEQVPRMCVAEILEAVKSILDFQEVTVTKRNKENPNYPK